MFYSSPEFGKGVIGPEVRGWRQKAKFQISKLKIQITNDKIQTTNTYHEHETCSEQRRASFFETSREKTTVSEEEVMKELP